MGNTLKYTADVVLMGLGGTLTFDLLGLLLKRVFGIPLSNICLVGRWLGYMPAGIFRHFDIRTAPARRAECALGWLGHYTIGILFAGVFFFLVGDAWIVNPTPLPAILFGIVTVAAPLLVMQPAFGLGWAGSRTSRPLGVLMRSLMNHLAYGVGLYVSGWAGSWLLFALV